MNAAMSFHIHVDAEWLTEEFEDFLTGELGYWRTYFVAPDGEKISERTLRRRSLKKSEVLSRGWRVIHKMPKHKYIWFEGSKSEKRHFIRKCRYKFLPYPKRVTAIDITRAEVK